MADECGPWIEHDGARPELAPGCVYDLRFCGPGKKSSDYQPISLDFPGFYWRWRNVRVGLFKTEKRRICDDPSYAAIVAYRLIKPRGMVILEMIAATPSQPVREDA